MTGRADKRDRALGRQRHVLERAGDFDRAAVQEAAAVATTPPAQPTSGRPRALPKGFPTGDAHRWVPIGPSVVRRGQANGRPRVSGRIRDLAVSDDGSRLYAASAMGGVWYSGNGGGSWDPVGGWADRAARSGGANNAQSCGCLLVAFGTDVGDDVVLVGTGETVPFLTSSGEGAYGGLGILAAAGDAAGPAARPVGANPWEPGAGAALLEGAGVFRLAREPGAVPGQVASPGRDRVLAATSRGLFLGERSHVAAPAPGHDEYTWTRPTSIDQLVHGAPVPPVGSATPTVSDVLWLPGGLVVVAVSGDTAAGRGIALSTDGGASFGWLAGCNNAVAATGVQGRSSLALVPGTSRLYVLTGLAATVAAQPDTPALFRVADVTVATPLAQPVGGVPIALWGAQRDYDQAIAVDVVGGTDRVYLGGSFFDLGQADFGASLWCFEVDPAPPVPPPATPFLLGPASGVSRTGAPAPPAPPAPPASAGDGADVAGHIGNNVHADVHRIVLGGPAAPDRQVWVGCDGGVYLSTRSGRVNTFASRATGLAVLQAGFVAAHPTSTHFVAAGFQDNGTQVRSGDTVWEEIFLGDGGGVMFHPAQSHYVVAQYVTASWSSAPARGFVSPTSRIAGGGTFTGDREAQQGVSEFYSGGSAMATGGTRARIAVGTNRVWISDDLGQGGAANRWRVLPFPSGPATDPRFADGSERAGQSDTGVPAGPAPLGPVVAAWWPNAVGNVGPLRGVVTVKWQSPTSVVAVFRGGVVRWVEAPVGQWTATVLLRTATLPAPTRLTDVAVVPGTQDLYLTTTGHPTSTAVDTCYLWDDATSALVATGLRAAMSPPPPPTGAVGPLDPAYSVVVDPAAAGEVYVGTATAVWHGTRTPGTTTVTWPPSPFVNGLPQAAVQDLSIWQSPAPPAAPDPAAPRLLRAAVQARGVWEVDLQAAAEPARTYLRVHARDDRRRLPTPLADPRRGPTAPAGSVHESPDVTVRPRADPAAAPAYAGQVITAVNVPAYQLWTFQTAFRWRYPSVLPTGLWSDAFGDLVQLHRAELRLPPGRHVDRPLWDAVVGGTRLAPDLTVSENAGHPLAVYRPAWQTPLDPGAVATEVDLLESVQPRSVTQGRWFVFSEPSTVDVLLHHRDTRPVPADEAFAMLLWRSDPSSQTLLATPATDVVAWAQGVAAGAAPPVPPGWQVGGAAPGRNPLSVPLDARLPRAVPIDVDLATVPRFHRVLLLAVGGSTTDPCSAAPVGMPAGPTVVDLVQRWPYAALRMVTVSPR